MRDASSQQRLVTFVLTLSVIFAPLLGFLVNPILGLVILACALLATVVTLQAVRAQAQPEALTLLTLLMAINFFLAVGCLCAAVWLAIP
jgi:hypothetical protein